MQNCQPVLTLYTNTLPLGPSRSRDPHRDPLVRPLLGPLVLAYRPAFRPLDRRLRFPHDDAVLSLRFVVGSVDLRLRSKLYGHLERAAILLRHVRSLQWCCAPIFRDACILEILDGTFKSYRRNSQNQSR